MKSFFTKKHALIAGIAAVSVGAVIAPVVASHSWSTYHWKRTSSELTIPVGDNVTAAWDSYLDVAIADWNQSPYINSPEVPGSVAPKRCNAVAGTIQVCNASYGRNGWLGLASINLVGGHISQGTTKLNDTYYGMAQYNTPAWRAAVMCQEIGHDYGLGHQDENTSDDLTNSCMEYTNNPVGNEHPDAHDYQQLATIYGHADAAFSAAGAGNDTAATEDVGDTPATWGRAIGYDKQGRPNVFERIDGPGKKTITHVYWAIGEGPRGNPHQH